MASASSLESSLARLAQRMAPVSIAGGRRANVLCFPVLKLDRSNRSEIRNLVFDLEGMRMLNLDQDTVHLQGPEGTPHRSWTTPMPGAHNASNAAAAAIIAHRAGAEWPEIIDAIESFAGLDRRLQRLGGRSLIGGGHVEVLDDYGHHPSEVEVTLRAIRGRWDPKRLICVFQPHQHSRTRFLLDQFATSFTLADIVIVPHIHFVRDSEAERNRVSAGDLVDRLRARGTTAMHMHPFEAIVEQLEVICRDGDLIVVMGAGSVWEIGRAFIDAERSAGDEP